MSYQLLNEVHEAPSVNCGLVQNRHTTLRDRKSPHSIAALLGRGSCIRCIELSLSNIPCKYRRPRYQKVYLKSIVSSSNCSPSSCFLFACQKYNENSITIPMIRIWDPILIQIAVMYLGASFCLTIKLPAIPPSPLQAVIEAANVALFHCPR